MKKMSGGNSNAGLNSKRVKIHKYSLEGEYLETYPSIVKASEDVGVTSSAIVKCAKGESKHSGGYIWRYNKEEVHSVKVKKSIVQIGETFESNDSGVFIVTSFIGKNNNLYKYGIRFLDTGYESVATDTNIRMGRVKDYLVPRVAGVGFLGKSFKNESKEEYDYRRSVYYVWNDMIKRCYDVNRPSYRLYGRIGVSVCSRWHNFSNFINDFSMIEGYDEDLFNKGKLILDKDLKQQNVGSGSRVYSLETCTLMSKRENSLLAREPDMIEYMIEYTDGTIEFGKNIEQLCRKIGLNSGSVRYYLSKRGTFSNNGLIIKRV